uniref:Uncharacterized protein n=1 Tax=Varanus komodoensis TaxID=61221 RepID=A0A8D2L9Q0_VARKO
MKVSGAFKLCFVGHSNAEEYQPPIWKSYCEYKAFGFVGVEGLET